MNCGDVQILDIWHKFEATIIPDPSLRAAKPGKGSRYARLTMMEVGGATSSMMKVCGATKITLSNTVR